jgi:Uma2 family endonuclease
MAAVATVDVDDRSLYPVHQKKHPGMCPPPLPPPGSDPDDRSLYPVHEEDAMTQSGIHLRQFHYVYGAIHARFPHRWVLGDQAHYWIRGDYRRYVSPDVSVVDGPTPDPLPNVYMAWQDPPLLFVAEVGSEDSVDRDLREKPLIYERLLKAREYLYAYPLRDDLRMWRIADGIYQPVAMIGGRFWSETLELWFGFDDTGFLRIYTPDGEMLLTQEEEAERRTEAERRVAELQAELDRLRRGG